MRSRAPRALAALGLVAAVVVPIVGGGPARAVPSAALDVEQYPVTFPTGDPADAPTLFVAHGGVWSASRDEVHAVDLAAGPLEGNLSAPFGPYVGRQFDGEVFWSVAVDRDAEPCPSPRPQEDPAAPWVLRGVAVDGAAPVRVIPLGWCGWHATRESWAASPVVVAPGRVLWASRTVPPAPGDEVGAETLRVDPSTGASAPVAPPGPPLVYAAAGDAAWGVIANVLGPLVNDPYGALLQRAPLARVADGGSVTLGDGLRGAYWAMATLAADAGGVWVASAERVPRFGGAPDPVLTRVTTRGRIVTVPTVRPWSIVSGDDGRTWFLGTTHRVAKGSTPQPVDWVLGRVDTRTGKHLRTYRLDLPPNLGTVTTQSGHLLDLLAATGGAVWMRAGGGGGVLLRVTERR